MDIDATDRRILTVLQKEGRITHRYPIIQINKGLRSLTRPPVISALDES